jgi:multidrug efflux pump subunit AcrB
MIEFFIRYRIWANVLMFSIFGFGLIGFNKMKYSFFPEMEPDFIIVQVVYPGAAPEEVEEGVILKIEENLDGLEGIERLTSTSSENFGVVNVEITSSAELDKVLTDVKNAVDQINSFPIGIEKPVIFEQKFRTRALSVVVFGETDLYNLKYIAEDLKDELIATREISQVAIQGLPDLEFSIEVSEANLRRYQMTFDEISRAVASANINISGGKLETKDEEILIRAYGRNYYTNELENLVVRGNPDGTVIQLKDIADVREIWEDVPNKSYYNGRTSLVLNIDKTEDEDIIAVADRAKALVATFNDSNDRVQALVLDDRTVPLRQRLALLTTNGLIGLLLVLVILGFFLNLRLSFWVSVGIPFSFAGMFIIANLWGITINVISLFGMILVVGILVDDAIVVGENIFSHYERGKTALRAAIDGTKEMVAPVTTAVMTTIIAFTPFFFLDGFVGKFIWHMAVVVIAALLFSLIETFFILPAHLAHSKALDPEQKISKIRSRIENGISFLTKKIYARILMVAMRFKWITVAFPFAFVMLTIGLIGGGFIGVTFFPFIDGDTLPVNVSLVSGRQEADTDSLLAGIEQLCWEVNDELKEEREDGRDVILGIKRDIGSNDFGDSGSHTGRLTLQLLDGEVRDMDSFIIANMIRSKVGQVPAAQKISFGRTSLFGKPVSLSLLGSNLDELNKARDLTMAELNNLASLKDITDTNQEGRREIDIRLKPKARALGLSLRDVAGQVRQGFFGQEVQRIQRGRDEIRVWVRYQPEDRASLGFLNQMRIRTSTGAEYPFSELAMYDIKRGITAINHLDRKREVRIEADLVDAELDLPPILAEIREDMMPRVLAQAQGVQVSFEGQSRDQEKMARSMQSAFSIAMLGMLILLFLVFRSYAQGLHIFSFIPFGIMGAIWGHGIEGIQVNTLSIYGIIALAGIVINDSIVFVDQINRNVRAGQKVFDAVFNAGLSRFRPILLTTLTTAAGLAPIIGETSRQAQFLIPMAVSVAYGLVFGTFLLLIVLPASYLVQNRLRMWISQLFTGAKVSPEEVEPAMKELAYVGELKNK